MKVEKGLDDVVAPRPLATRIPAGLCERCVHLRLASSPRSVFVRCGHSDRDQRFPRYPSLPVLSCDGFEKVGPAFGAVPEGRDSG